MNNWNLDQTENNEEIFSLADDNENQSEVIDSIKQDEPKESITQLGASYEIKKVSSSKQNNRSFPTVLLVLVVIAPLLFVFAMGTLSNRNKDENDSFLFNSVESEYFTLTVDSEYTVDSVIDKKVPFLERHILNSNVDGQKTLTIMVKDIKFDYSLDDNLNAKARRENPAMYTETTYELDGKKGLYFRKNEESFEHFILLVDRSKSILYEITMESPTTFANDVDLGTELTNILSNLTFLE